MEKIINNIEWREIYIDKGRTDYLISNTGVVYSKKSKKILKPQLSNCGYLRVELYINGCSYKKSIHRLVAIAFIPNPLFKPQVNHKNGDKTNNNVSNLEWVTESENEKEAYRIGLKTSKLGEESHFCKTNKSTIKYICKLIEDGEYTLIEISNLTNVSIAMIYRIYWRKSWTNISYKYDFENCKQSHNKYTDIQIEKVFKYLSEDELTIYEISDKTNVKTSTIYNILIRRSPEKYLYFYSLYDVSNYHSNKKMENFPDDIRLLIIQKLKIGETTKNISRYIHDNYGYNVDRVRHYAYRIKNKLGSTTIERDKGV